MLKVAAKFQTTLAAGISASDTSLTLTSIEINNSEELAEGETYGFVIDEGNANEEYIIGEYDTIGEVIDLLRGVRYQDGETGSSDLAKSHRKGATVKITDHPALRQIINVLSGDTTLPNVIKSSEAPVGDDDLANKAYVDGVAVAGGADASTSVKGISKLSSAPASPTNPIAVGDNDPRLPTTDEKAALAGVGTPSSTSKFISEAGITGIVLPYAGSSAPTGFFLCDGAAVSRTTYARLFGIIGTTYGAGDGSTTFNIPNLKGRIPVGLNSSETEFDNLGETGGAKTHTLTAAESGLPAHSHVQRYRSGGSSDYSFNYGTIGAADNQVNGNTSTADNTSASASSAHNNLQPYIVLNYIIKT